MESRLGGATAAPEEQGPVLAGCDAAAAQWPPELCVHQLVEQQAASTPDALAAVCEATELTYAQLNARANQLARRLVDLGVRPESRVALCVERSLELLVGLLAILKAGGAY